MIIVFLPSAWGATTVLRLKGGEHGACPALPNSHNQAHAYMADIA
ncbi:MAG TPA: hypothetical protein VNG69_14905 [Casimicrobiaceae bacterium]|nr:hypothetical protein [Casimicrobiaceae bacterium]